MKKRSYAKSSAKGSHGMVKGSVQRSSLYSGGASAGKKPSYVLPVLIAGGVGIAIFMLTKKSSAAPGTPGAALQPGSPAPSPAFLPSGLPGLSPSSPFQPASLTPSGPSQTRFVIAPDGLKLRSGPGVNFPEVGPAMPFGTRVQVVQDVTNGWTQLSSPAGFTCNTCAEAPGGPWLSATPPGLAAAPGSPPAMPAVSPAGVVVSTTVPGVTATVIAPSGLKLRSGAGVNFPQVGMQVLPSGTVVKVLQSAANGWTQVQPPTGPSGFVCSTCAEAPGGPWLSTPGTVSAGMFDRRVQRVPLG
jgi:uncharacterized protein YgiM (DUF1202 family)